MIDFDPLDPFGEGPSATPPMEEEIERHVADFVKLGLNAHSTVAMWLGKPNRFTGVVMQSALEILEYVSAELNATQHIQAQVKAASKDKGTGKPALVHAAQAGTGDDIAGAGSTLAAAEQTAPAADAKRAHKDAVNAANLEWREAIQQRNEAIRQWDLFVAGKRDIYQRLKLMKV